jgi:hypothetical protein
VATVALGGRRCGPRLLLRRALRHTLERGAALGLRSAAGATLGTGLPRH